jgi:large subunit ribosomal protein L18
VSGESRVARPALHLGQLTSRRHYSLLKVNDQMNKNAQRLRRATRSRAKIRELKALRLSVHRTPQHIYAQIFDSNSKVLAVASTLQKDVRDGLKGTGNATAAAAVGKAIAEKAKAAGITQVAFDRSGFKFHGRIKALADAARENGLEF